MSAPALTPGLARGFASLVKSVTPGPQPMGIDANSKLLKIEILDCIMDHTLTRSHQPAAYPLYPN